jgi:hypothetical protein
MSSSPLHLGATFRARLNLSGLHALHHSGETRFVSPVLKRLLTTSRGSILDSSIRHGLLSVSPGRRPSILRTMALLPNRSPQLCWVSSRLTSSPSRDATGLFRYAAIATVAALVSGLSHPSFASPLSTPAPSWAIWTPQVTLIVATAASLLLWWKRAWLNAWLRWLRGLFRDLGAALGTRHHVIHDRRYLEEIIKAELESGPEALSKGQGSRPSPGPDDPSPPRPSSRSLLRQDSRRRR